MSRRRAVLTTLGILAAGVIIFRITILPDLLIRQMIPEVPGDSQTPADVGLPFEDVSFVVDGDRLAAWFVEPPDPQPIAFLLFHGDGASISVFIRVQKLLFDAGYASLVYDYGGFGHSEGVHSSRIFEAEPPAALEVLLDRTKPDTKVVVLGHSFGSAVSVAALHDQDHSMLHSVVFASGPPALRDILHEVLGVPRPVTWLLPNVINAKDDIADFDVPVLVVATQADEVVPYELTLRVFEGASQPKQLHLLEEGGHSDLYRAEPEWWSPVLAWIEEL